MRLRPLLLCMLSCACGETGTFTKITPKLVIDPPVLDFGEVPLGSKRFSTVRLKNAGSAPLELGEIATWAPYGVDPASTMVLEPTRELELLVGYGPRDLVRADGMIVVHSNDPEAPEQTIALSGSGGPGDLDVRPPVVEYHATPVATVRGLRILLGNRGASDRVATVTTHRIARPEHFSLAGQLGFDLPPITIPAVDQAALRLEYHPLAAGFDAGRILFETCGPGCGLAVEIDADALYDGVRLEPAALDFGTLGIGSQKRLEVLVYNEGDEPIELRSAQITGGSELTTMIAGGLPSTISPHAATVIGVDFAPTTAREIEAMLSVSAGPPGLPELRVAIVGRGAGARLVLSPEVIEFGTQYRPGVGRRTILLENAGSAPTRILSARIEGDAPLSLVAGGPGLPIQLAPGESTYFEVEANLQALGSFGATLRVTTDGEATLHEVPIHASYEQRDCDLEVLTPQLNFGLILPGSQVTMTLTAINHGDGVCNLVQGERVSPFDAGFSLDESRFPIQVPSGGTLAVDFQFAPQLAGPAKLTYQFVTDESPAFRYRVALVGVGGEDCDGSSPNCFCGAGQTVVYHRFDFGHPSGVFRPEEVPIYRAVCEGTNCDFGEVSVETTAGVYTCAPPPPVCAGTTALELVPGSGWRCVPCDVVIQYGAIYDGMRICAPPPPASLCPPGEVQTFRVESEAWECATTCDNGLYDQVFWDGTLVCVPC